MRHSGPQQLPGKGLNQAVAAGIFVEIIAEEGFSR
jgi:hypothetical protein